MADSQAHQVTPIQLGLASWFSRLVDSAKGSREQGLKNYAMALSIGLQIGRTNPELVDLLLKELINNESYTQKLVNDNIIILETAVLRAL